MEKLAINGGFPVRGGKIYYGRQWIDEDDILAVINILKLNSGRLLINFITLICSKRMIMISGC